MNSKQRAVIKLGVILVLMICVFPYKRYMDVQESPADPATISLDGLPKGARVSNLKFATREGFRPIWQSADPLSMDQGGGVSFGLGILWPHVLAMVAGVAILAGVGVSLLRSNPDGAGPGPAGPGERGQ